MKNFIRKIAIKCYQLLVINTLQFFKLIFIFSDILFNLIYSIILSYLQCVYVVIRNRESEQWINLDVTTLHSISRQCLSTWITLTPGTISFIDQNQKNTIIIHSILGNMDLNPMLHKIKKWETLLIATISKTQ